MSVTTRAFNPVLAPREYRESSSGLLPLSAKLERFTCFCQRPISVKPMGPNTVRITSCECGRRWRQQT